MKIFLLFLSLIIFISISAQAQLFAGAGYGTFRKQADYKGTGPTISLLYTKDEDTEDFFFLNTSFYKKTGLDYGPTEIYNEDGSYAGDAQKIIDIKTTHLEAGFYKVLGNLDKPAIPKFTLGAGVALSKINANYNFVQNGNTVSSYTTGDNIFGFNFNAGLMSRVSKLVIELRGSFNIMLQKDIPVQEDESLPRLGSTRLSFYYPLTK